MPYICRNPLPITGIFPFLLPSPYIIYNTKLFGDLGAVDGNIIYHLLVYGQEVVWPY